MKKPIIAVTTSTFRSEVGMDRAQVSQSYVNAIQQAGGIPILIAASVTPDDAVEIARSMDGLLLTGGGDVAPDIFGGAVCPQLTGVDNPRDAIELALAKAFHVIDKPVFGICRGAQVMNIALGGTLYTDIPTQYKTEIQHRNQASDTARHRRELTHQVSILAGTKLANTMSVAETEVNSFHHQAIKKLADGLIESANAPDGIIEGIEDPTKRFFLGVQWHPEWLTAQEQTRALFSTFINAC